jgi:hypothetical protein
MAFNLKTQIKMELMSEKSYYEEVADSFVIEKIPEGNIVASEEWSAAALDVGADWKWRRLPPLDKIKEWVRKHKDGGKYAGAPEQEVNDIAVAVQKKIKKEGVDSHFYIHEAINNFSDNEVDFD